MSKVQRKIVTIDEDKCDGCGLCIPACHEGALQIIDGKAKLIQDRLCDGLGDCLGHCPQDAIIIETRVADEFDEEAVEQHLLNLKKEETAKVEQPVSRCAPPATDSVQWPIQLKLLNPAAPFFKNADLLFAADCVPFTAPTDYDELRQGKAVMIGCPKLDDAMSYVEKVAEIVKVAAPSSITIAYMEVPCCGGLLAIVKEALNRAGKEVPVSLVKVGIDGSIK